VPSLNQKQKKNPKKKRGGKKEGIDLRKVNSRQAIPRALNLGGRGAAAGQRLARPAGSGEQENRAAGATRRDAGARRRGAGR